MTTIELDVCAARYTETCQQATISSGDLQRECQARLENFIVPEHVEFVSSPPRTDTGKIEKTTLR